VRVCCAISMLYLLPHCRELRKWVDTTEKAHATLHARREARAGRLASALRALEKVGRNQITNCCEFEIKQVTGSLLVCVFAPPEPGFPPCTSSCCRRAHKCCEAWQEDCGGLGGPLQLAAPSPPRS